MQPILNLKRNPRLLLRSLLMASGAMVLSLFAPSAAHALGSTDITTQVATDPLLVVDSNYCSTGEGPRAGYVGITITNTSGRILTGLEADLSNLTNGFSLAGGQAVTQFIGQLAVGASRTVYWYTQYAIDCTGPGGSFKSTKSALTINVRDSSPGVVTDINKFIQTGSYISANAGGQVLSSLLGPGYVVGQVIPFEVEYSFGNNDVGDITSAMKVDA
jgi:hypothetical protein